MNIMRNGRTKPLLIILSLVLGIGLMLLYFARHQDQSAVFTNGRGVAKKSLSSRPSNTYTQGQTSTKEEPSNQFQKSNYFGKKVFINKPLLLSNGSINPVIIREFQLSNEEQLLLVKTLQVLANSVAERAKANLVVDPVLTDEAKGVTAYKIEAFPKDGVKILEDFKVSLIDAFGKQRGKDIFELFPAHLYYGNMGTNDISVTFSEQDVGDGIMVIGVKCLETNPTTGQMDLKREGSFEQLNKFLPGVFDVKSVNR